MKEELSDLIVLCEHASDAAFQNGVVHDGIDEGDVVASNFIARAKTALAREDAVTPLARELLAKMDRVFKNGIYLNIFTSGEVRCMQYRGLDFVTEMETLRKALNA